MTIILPNLDHVFNNIGIGIMLSEYYWGPRWWPLSFLGWQWVILITCIFIVFFGDATRNTTVITYIENNLPVVKKAKKPKSLPATCESILK